MIDAQRPHFIHTLIEQVSGLGEEELCASIELDRADTVTDLARLIARDLEQLIIEQRRLPGAALGAQDTFCTTHGNRGREPTNLVVRERHVLVRRQPTDWFELRSPQDLTRRFDPASAQLGAVREIDGGRSDVLDLAPIPLRELHT